MDDVKQITRRLSDRTDAIVVIGDVTPEGARVSVGKWFGGDGRRLARAGCPLPRVPINAGIRVTVPDPASYKLGQSVRDGGYNAFDGDYYPLQLGQCAGRGIYATRLYMTCGK